MVNDLTFACPICDSLLQVFTAESGPYIGCGECLYADFDHRPAADLTAEQDHASYRPDDDPHYSL